MSFPILTRAELITALQEAAIDSPFFEAHPVDAVSSCKYHDVRSDVESGCYTFKIFISTYKQFVEENEPFSIGEIRLLAQQTFVRAMRAKEREVTVAWQDGLMV